MIDRRTFLATSTMTVVAAALQDVALIGQGQLTTSFEELRRGLASSTGRAAQSGGWSMETEYSSSTARMRRPLRPASTD